MPSSQSMMKGFISRISAGMIPSLTRVHFSVRLLLASALCSLIKPAGALDDESQTLVYATSGQHNGIPNPASLCHANRMRATVSTRMSRDLGRNILGLAADDDRTNFFVDMAAISRPVEEETTNGKRLHSYVQCSSLRLNLTASSQKTFRFSLVSDNVRY